MTPRERLVARTCGAIAAIVAVGSVAALFAPPRGDVARETERRAADAALVDRLARPAAPAPGGAPERGVRAFPRPDR